MVFALINALAGNTSLECYTGDVNALLAYGYDAVKLDGCGAEYDLDLWSSLITTLGGGKVIEIENCHWGGTLPNATWCPWNFYRTSGDVRANFGSILGNLATVPPLANKNLSTPGCYAYADMLEVGCAAGPGGSSDSGLTFAESRTHFGGWCIVSSPLTLSHDVNNDTITDFIWPIISNTEAIAVNQNYFGFSGSSFASTSNALPDGPGNYVVAVTCNSTDATQIGWTYSTATQSLSYAGQCVDTSTGDQVLLAACTGSANQKLNYNTATKYFEVVANAGQCLDIWAGNGEPGGPAVQVYGCHGGDNQEFAMSGGAVIDGNGSGPLCFASRSSVPGLMNNFYKPMSWDKTKYAVLLINTDSVPTDLSVSFSDVPGLVFGHQCMVRDIWAKQDIGFASGNFTAKNVDTHDAAFLMLTC